MHLSEREGAQVVTARLAYEIRGHADRMTSPMPTVSVVMPVYNGRKFLEEAILSIRNQSLRDLELIVVDNGSTDGSYDIAARHADEDPRVRVLRLDHPGVAAALQTGIEAARAPWVARMDADDISLPDRLRRQMEFLAQHPDLGALGTYGWIIGERGNRVGMFRAGPTSVEAFLRKRTENKLIYLLSSSVVFSRDLAIALGGHRQDYAPAEDVDFWTRIADTHVVLTIPEPLVCYRIHLSAASTKHSALQAENARRARVNAARRRSELPEFTIEEFREFERADSRLVRLKRFLSVRGQYCYRKGGAMLANGRPDGVLWLALGATIAPSQIFRKLRRQSPLRVLATRISESLAN